MNIFKHFSIVWIITLIILSGFSKPTSAQNCQEVACAHFSTRSGLINDVDVLLTNLLISAQLGVNVQLNQTQLQSFSDAQLDINDLTLELMSQTSAATVQQLETKAISLSTLIDAAIAVTSTPATIQALQVLQSQTSGNSNTFVIGDFLEISLLNLSLSNGFISLKDILDGAISHIFYADNTGSTPIYVSLNGSVLGLGLANQIDVYLIVTEPATIACGEAGATFTSASTRLKIILDLADSDKTTALQSVLSTLGISLDVLVSDLQLSITQLELYVDLSRAEGEIISINPENNEVMVQATPSLADFYLGDIDDNLFFSNSQINPTTDLDFANVGTLGFEVLGTAVSASVQIKSYSKDVSGVNTETLTFTGPYSETQTIGDNRAHILSLIEALVTNADLEVKLELDESIILSPIQQTIVGPTLDLLVPAVTALLTDLLENTLLDPILTLLVDPILRQLGGLLGRADVIVEGIALACYAEINGMVYEDSNHNYMPDGSETGTGESIYAKLIDESDPAKALQVVAVNTSTGTYQFANVLQGNYTIVIATNNTTNITPGKPSGWLATQTEDLEWSNIQLNGVNKNGINFGFFHGSKISGISFIDNGEGGGVAYNGAKDGNEKYLYNRSISVITAAGANLIDKTTTNSAGEFTLWISHTYDASSLIIKEIEGASYINVSGNTGNTSGSYNLANDEITFTANSGNEYSGVAFGNAEVPVFSPEGQQQAIPGTAIYFPHTFTANSPGIVSFILTKVSSTANENNWSTLIYEDLNCNGLSETGEPIIDEKTLATKETLCIVAKVFVPSQASYGESLTINIDAEFTLQGTSIVHPTSVMDITIVGDASGAGLKIEKTVDKEEAFPGEVILYTLTYSNNSYEPISQVNIQDATPAYTTFISATCEEIPSEITACTITDPAVGNSGNITWEFTGPFLPGETIIVRYSVKIQ